MSEPPKRTTISHQVWIHYDPSVLIRLKYDISCQIWLIFQITYPVRFGWSLLSTYKCSLMAMELDFLHLASHRWFKKKIPPHFLTIFRPSISKSVVAVGKWGNFDARRVGLVSRLAGLGPSSWHPGRSITCRPGNCSQNSHGNGLQYTSIFVINTFLPF